MPSVNTLKIRIKIGMQPCSTHGRGTGPRPQIKVRYYVSGELTLTLF